MRGEGGGGGGGAGKAFGSEGSRGPGSTDASLSWQETSEHNQSEWIGYNTMTLAGKSERYRIYIGEPEVKPPLKPAGPGLWFRAGGVLL